MPRLSSGQSSTQPKTVDEAQATPTRCGHVALIGAPNAGKSTLLNRLVGRKLAIVTPKPQTTRTRLLGIAIEGPAQIIYVDTPGIFAPRRRLDRAMVAAAWSGAEDAEQTVLLVDAARGVDRDTRRILDRRAIWQFVTQLQKDLLAGDLGRDHPLGHVGQLVLGKQPGALR